MNETVEQAARAAFPSHDIAQHDIYRRGVGVECFEAGAKWGATWEREQEAQELNDLKKTLNHVNLALCDALNQLAAIQEKARKLRDMKEKIRLRDSPEGGWTWEYEASLEDFIFYANKCAGVSDEPTTS